jgi:hypothetical protein
MYLPCTTHASPMVEITHGQNVSACSFAVISP